MVCAGEGPEQFVFGDGRRAVAYKTLCTYLHEATQKAGVSGITLHVLRHTYITNLHLLGADHHTMKELAGHANDRTMEIYPLSQTLER